MKHNIDRLCNLVTKLIEIIENEIQNLSDEQSSSSVKAKRSITDNLAKLVSLIEKLNKLKKDNQDESVKFQDNDQLIIQEFLNKYLK